MRLGRVMSVGPVRMVTVCVVAVRNMRMPGVNVAAIGVRIVAAMTRVSMPAKSANRHSRESNSTERESGEIYVHWS